MSKNDIAELRRRRFTAFVETFDTKAEAGRVLDMAPSYVNQIISGHRTLGEKAARLRERAAELPKGYFDGVDIDANTLTLDEQKLIDRYRYLDTDTQQQALGYMAFLKSTTFKGDESRRKKVQQNISAPQVHEDAEKYDKR